MYLLIHVELAFDHFGLSLTQIDPILKKICAKYDVYIFIPSDHDLCPLDLKFALLVIIVQRNVSSKLEVSKPFLLRDKKPSCR